jgi:hypothetical protein
VKASGKPFTSKTVADERKKCRPAAKQSRPNQPDKEDRPADQPIEESKIEQDITVIKKVKLVVWPKDQAEPLTGQLIEMYVVDFVEELQSILPGISWDILCASVGLTLTKLKKARAEKVIQPVQQIAKKEKVIPDDKGKVKSVTAPFTLDNLGESLNAAPATVASQG